jgi:hypothetical protein
MAKWAQVDEDRNNKLYYKFDGRTTFQKCQKCEIITNIHDHIIDENNIKKKLHLLIKKILKATSEDIPYFFIIVMVHHHIGFHVYIHNVEGMSWVRHC